MRRFFSSRFTLAITWIACFMGTHLPVPETVSLEDGRDKILHFIGYFGLSALLSFQQLNSSIPRLKAAGQTLILIMAYAAIDELTQPYVGRTAEWMDWFVDGIGALAAITIVIFIFGGVSRLHPRQ